jgi:hypothetical protein
MTEFSNAFNPAREPKYVADRCSKPSDEGISFNVSSIEIERMCERN